MLLLRVNTTQHTKMDLDSNVIKSVCGGDEVLFSQAKAVVNENTTCSSSTNSGESNTTLTRKGKRWTAEEEEKLSTLYGKDNKGVDTIANILERSPFAIVCRLVSIGMISDAANIRGFSNNMPTFERAIELKGTDEEVVLPSFVKRPKEKKVKVPREKKPKVYKPKVCKSPNVKNNRKHPTFKVMITKALEGLAKSYDGNHEDYDEQWGSLVYIKKYLQTNYNIDPRNRRQNGCITRTIASMLKDGVLRCPEGRKVYSLTRMNLPYPVSLERKKGKEGYYSDEYSSTEESDGENYDADDESYDDTRKEIKKESKIQHGFVADTYGGGKAYVPFHTLYPNIMKPMEINESTRVYPVGGEFCRSNNSEKTCHETCHRPSDIRKLMEVNNSNDSV